MQKLTSMRLAHAAALAPGQDGCVLSEVLR
jgi:hypothetical protein